MGDVDAVIDEMAAYLTERHINVPREWLCGLLEHIEENEPQYRDKMAQAAYWYVLETDLNILRCGSLPADLANVGVRNVNITGHFFLQINKVIDICHSAYGQFKKINPDSDDDDDDLNEDDDAPDKSNRTLDLELTDGVQIVSGMEWEPMPFLSVNTKPGSKILVHGEVECRRGVLFLCPENTKFLGGEVDDLTEVNSQVNVLKQKVEILKTEWEASPDYNPNVPPPSAFNTQPPIRPSASTRGARGASAVRPDRGSPFHSRGTRPRRPGGSSYRQRTGGNARRGGRIARPTRASTAGRPRSGATGRPRGGDYASRPRGLPTFPSRAVRRPAFRTVSPNVPTSSTGQLGIEMDTGTDDDDEFWSQFCADPASH